MNFYSELKKNLLKESINFFNDNYDYQSRGKIPSNKKISNWVKSILFHPIVFKFVVSKDFIFRPIILGQILKIEPYMDGIANLYEKLNDKNSKELLIKIVSFRIMGYTKVKIPFHTDEYWTDLEKLKSNRNESNIIELDYKPWKLFYHDLTPYNLDIKLFFTTHRTYAALIREHYKYVGDEITIDAEKDDVVLDLGGCYGDTALYFSNKVGKNGKVYSFEFIPLSIEIFEKNLNLNPELKDNIEIVNNPIWNESGINMYYQDRGAASKVSFENFVGQDGEIPSISIDDFVSNYNLDRVDFIKTDIEGAEPYALDGSKKTLQKFKPKLAISIYHNMNDFTGIIQQIHSMNIGYKFYLGHASIYASETVLFCIAE